MTSYETWQMKKYGNYLPDSDPAIEETTDDRFAEAMPIELANSEQSTDRMENYTPEATR